jgi:hypothetical protein
MRSGCGWRSNSTTTSPSPVAMPPSTSLPRTPFATECARFTTGIDHGADPAVGPTDFHACVEASLADLFDPSGTAIPMGFVRLLAPYHCAQALSTDG